jgi:hypothetical protein
MIEYLELPTDQLMLEVRVELDAPPASAELNERLAANALILREFFAAGGIVQSRTTPGPRVPLSPNILNAVGASFRLSFRPWQFGGEGLGVILRVLEHTVARVPPRAPRISVAAPSWLLSELTDAQKEIPSRDPNLPFAADIHPINKWLNLECEFIKETPPPDVAARLDRLMHLWAHVGELGGFDVSQLLRDLDPPMAPAGIAVMSPAVGEDFMQWQFAISGTQFGAENVLVNMIADFSRQVFPISFLYLG